MYYVNIKLEWSPTGAHNQTALTADEADGHEDATHPHDGLLVGVKVVLQLDDEDRHAAEGALYQHVEQEGGNQHHHRIALCAASHLLHT